MSLVHNLEAVHEFFWFEKQVKYAVKQCFYVVDSHVLYSTNELFSATTKDVLPALQKSNVIYQFLCYCDSRYVGRTSQRLQERIKQHVPKSIRFRPRARIAWLGGGQK